MPAYLYPIIIKREKQIINFDEVVTIEKNSLTLADLQFVGGDEFSITEGIRSDSQFPGDGYIINVSRTRSETDEEFNSRVASEESYMKEYNKRHPKLK